LKSLPAAIAAVLFTSGSWAALGGSSANLGPQTALAKSSTLSTGMATYTVLQKELDSGTTVHEYVDASGTVFAVAWSGPFLPDLKEILGVHFETMQSQAAKRQHARHSRMAVRGADVVILSTGHMRALQGRAWVPSKLPAGFDASAAKWPT
jgi:hypothetical protein